MPFTSWEAPGAGRNTCLIEFLSEFSKIRNIICSATSYLAQNSVSENASSLCCYGKWKTNFCPDCIYPVHSRFGLSLLTTGIFLSMPLFLRNWKTQSVRSQVLLTWTPSKTGSNWISLDNGKVEGCFWSLFPKLQRCLFGFLKSER